MSLPLLDITGLTKRFGALVVSRGVDLVVLRHEVHAVIGPNGAGKTSLVNQVSGLVPPDAGTIRFRGTDITRLSPPARARLGIARTFQVSSIVPSLTVLDNVRLAALAAAGATARLGRRFSAVREHDAAAAARLDAVGLGGREGVPAGTLAHGERRALELAMALVQEPALLLLDEPMAGAGRAETEELTRVLMAAKGSVAMLLVEHDMEAVFALADRITVLVDGAVVASGPPAAVRADPVVRRAYLGEEPARPARAPEAAA